MYNFVILYDTNFMFTTSQNIYIIVFPLFTIMTQFSASIIL